MMLAAPTLTAEIILGTKTRYLYLKHEYVCQETWEYFISLITILGHYQIINITPCVYPGVNNLHNRYYLCYFISYGIYSHNNYAKSRKIHGHIYYVSIYMVHHKVNSSEHLRNGELFFISSIIITNISF